MNDAAILLLDASGGPEYWALASSSLAAILAGIVLLVLKRHLALRDEAQRLHRDADNADRKRVEAAIAGLGLQLSAEAEERRNAVTEEARVRREKDEVLGKDLVSGLGKIREAFSYYCGKMDEKRPKFDQE